ncbi:hypothetical protein CEXT_658921 [Caerostris extrusa]|uniref:Uncharacterized protein n=1 Tax=Caerostris extrusa TaxID=172846 RepID=A0AAV4NKG4_CAEEX|nr:hypothetical protein CEXT_658921 [Caerostris extrusa]
MDLCLKLRFRHFRDMEKVIPDLAHYFRKKKKHFVAKGVGINSIPNLYTNFVMIRDMQNVVLDLAHYLEKNTLPPRVWVKQYSCLIYQFCNDQRHAECYARFGALFQKKILCRQGCGLNIIPIQQQYSYPIFQFCNDQRHAECYTRFGALFQKKNTCRQWCGLKQCSFPTTVFLSYIPICNDQRHAVYYTRFGPLLKKPLCRQGCGLNCIPIQQQYSYPIFHFVMIARMGLCFQLRFRHAEWGYQILCIISEKNSLSPRVGAKQHCYLNFAMMVILMAGMGLISVEVHYFALNYFQMILLPIDGKEWVCAFS